MSNTALRAILTEIAAATIKPQPPASTATMEDWRNRQIERFRRKGAEALALLDQAGGDADRGGWRPIDDEAKSGEIIEVLVDYEGGGSRKQIVLTAAYKSGDFTPVDERGDEIGDRYLEPLAWRPAPEPIRPTFDDKIVALDDREAAIVRTVVNENRPDRLSSAFDWEHTPQGHDFWEKECDRSVLSQTARAILTASLRAYYTTVGSGIEFVGGGAEIIRTVLSGGLEPHNISDAFVWSKTPQGDEFWDREQRRSSLSDEARRILVAALYLHDAKGEIS